MLKRLILLMVFALSTAAKDISNEKLGFKISFPDAKGWAPVEYESQGSWVHTWSAGNDIIGMAMNLGIVDVPMPEPGMSFKAYVEEWASGMKQRFSQTISSRFAKLGGQDAYELVASLKDENGTLFLSNWIVRIGDRNYCITIMSDKLANLSGNEATTFLKSLEIIKPSK